MSGFSTKVEFSRVFPTLDNTLSSREWRQGSGLLHPLGGATIYYARDEDRNPLQSYYTRDEDSFDIIDKS